MLYELLFRIGQWWWWEIMVHNNVMSFGCLGIGMDGFSGCLSVLSYFVKKKKKKNNNTRTDLTY